VRRLLRALGIAHSALKGRRTGGERAMFRQGDMAVVVEGAGARSLLAEFSRIDEYEG
jgi:hypothetical protein